MRSPWLADLVILVGHDGIYAPPVRDLRLAGTPSWLLAPGYWPAAKLRKVACAADYIGLVGRRRGQPDFSHLAMLEPADLVLPYTRADDCGRAIRADPPGEDFRSGYARRACIAGRFRTNRTIHPRVGANSRYAHRWRRCECFQLLTRSASTCRHVLPAPSWFSLVGMRLGATAARVHRENAGVDSWTRGRDRSPVGGEAAMIGVNVLWGIHLTGLETAAGFRRSAKGGPPLGARGSEGVPCRPRLALHGAAFCWRADPRTGLARGRRLAAGPGRTPCPGWPIGGG